MGGDAGGPVGGAKAGARGPLFHVELFSVGTWHGPLKFLRFSGYRCPLASLNSWR